MFATHTLPRSLSAAALGAVLWIGSGTADAVLVITKPDFSDISDLTLNGRAATVGNPILFGGKNVLRLTDATGQGGSAFSTNQINLGAGASFSTFFEFQMSSPFNGGADGIVFVVQTVANNVGGGGGGIGYAGLNNSVGVEFDTFNNGGGDSNNANHVGINTNGSLSSVALTPVAPAMDTGTPFFAWIDYDGSTLEVRLDTVNVRPAAVIVSAMLDIPTILGQTNAFVGFTSGTGIASNLHDIRQWQVDNSFNPIGVPGDPTVPAPSTLALLGIGSLMMAGLLGWRRRRTGGG